MTDLKRTARITGALYLLLALSGFAGFLFARSVLDATGDARTTTANLVDREGLARFGLAAELTVVLAQTLVALAFYRLFRDVSRFAGACLVGFAFLGAMSVLVAVTTLAGAVDVATSGGSPDVVRGLFDVSDAAWDTGGLLFGLWLVPMGYLAYVSRYMPRALGVLLVVGGAGYLVSTYLVLTWPGMPAWVSGALTVPATAGELWMVGHLLSVGVLTRAARPVPVA
jgi:hypothetical protein